MAAEGYPKTLDSGDVEPDLCEPVGAEVWLDQRERDEHHFSRATAADRIA